MRIASFALRSLNGIASLQSYRQIIAKTLSTNAAKGSLESTEDFEERIFGENPGNDDKTRAFFQHLGRAEKEARYWQDGKHGESGFSSGGFMEDHQVDDIDLGSDGMDDKLKKAATYFEMDADEIDTPGYSFRPDVPTFENSYTLRDLDLTKPGIPGEREEDEFEVTTEEVLQKADFRNVRFLANFITESGIIIQRKQTAISAKAQRKIAREIKTARAFGLMPFTTMGTKAFIVGNSMESKDEDFQYEANEDEDDVNASPSL